ncbi:unnamed protein product [Euphydryas editha]|uniref:ISXO2-like transposase domain-containing protein n=1 Tax=Euphydryas editha TaxID=104508 RepID=A0AAU9U7Z3_EUPED|nr:unnamed protein product [Euphydryas editha]
MWNLIKVFRELGTREQAIAFAEERGNYHKKPILVEYSTNKTVGSFVCNKGVCRTKSKVSQSKGTWFENNKIELAQVYWHILAYYCRESVVIYQIEKRTFDGKIGGPGKIVQIDESKFGKRKYNKGRHIEGQWVLDMIEDGSEDLRLEICPDNVRSADVLLPWIEKHVAEGTIIHTDIWRAYSGLENYGYIHKTVNHSDPENPFVAPDGTHTQRIQSQWRLVKRFFAKDNYNNRENFTL